MKSSEPDQLAVRLAIFRIDAKGPSAIRMIGKATRALIFAVAASVWIVALSYTPLWQTLNGFYR
jgi:hypothetical protein